MAPHLTLYTRAGCHLCEEAAQLLAEHFPDLDVDLIDVDKQRETKEKYGLRVPVACIPGGPERDWPFGPADIEDLLNGA